MDRRVKVGEFGGALVAGVATGNDAAHFERAFRRRVYAWARLGPESAHHLLYAAIRGRFSPEHSLFRIPKVDQGPLMDLLVEWVDDDVEWPDYHWSLENLRARRDRLRRPEGPVAAPSSPTSAATQRYPNPVIAAYRVLGCRIGADLDAAQAAYREQSLKHHPDRGGSHAAMVRINRAYDLVRRFLQGTAARR